MKVNYAEIRKSPVHMTFLSTMKNSKNTFLVNTYVDSVATNAIVRIHDDFDSLID